MERWRRWVGGLVSLVLVVAMAAACSDDDADPGSAEGAGGTGASDATTTVALPDQDRSIDVEAGRVLFHQWADDSSRQLGVVSSAGGAVTELGIEGFGGVLGPAVAPDGRQVAALGWAPDEHERNTTVLLGDLEAGFEAIYADPDLTFWCVRWHPDGDRLLLTAFDDQATDPVLLSIGLDGTATELAVPPGRYECAVPLADGRIVLTYAGEGTGLVGMALVRPSSPEVEVLHSKVGCLLYGPSPSWTRHELVVAASCEEPADSGVHVVDLATGEADHVVVGEVAFPSFSPSGDWIAFGLFPSPDSLKATVWAVTRDGTGLRQLTEVAGAQPAWVAPAAPAGP